MNFLTPAFFLGALALAVPIFVHLTHREKKEVVEFPSLMFLRRIPYRSVRRQKLRHLLLFALRCLAITLLIIAFARPFFESEVAATASSLGPREVVLVLDHSYSMGYEGRLDRAKTEARSLVAGLGPEERGSIVVVSDRAEILVQSSADPAELTSAIDSVALSARTTRYGPGLKLAQKIVDESELARKEVVLLSDFQRLGWEGDEDVLLPQGTRLSHVNLGTDSWENLTVTDVILEREPASGRERLTVSARVTNKTGADAEPTSTTIGIELGARTLQTKDVELAPNSSTTVTFDPFTLPAGVSRGTVRLGDDKLTADNAYHFVLWPGQSIGVVVVEGQRRRSLYLDRALAIGDRPSFRVTRKASGQFRGSDLRGQQVVVVNDVRSLGASQASAVLEFVNEGGGLIVVLGAASGENLFPGPAAALLPAAPGSVVDRSRDWGGTLSYLDYGSAVFELFGAPHSGDFSQAKFFRYRAFGKDLSDGVLARFDDGAVALADKRVGDGRVLVWTSTFDTFWNDLARQPVFLPFAHQLVKLAAGYEEASSWYAVGEVADLMSHWEMALGSSPAETELVVTSPSEEREVLTPSDGRVLLPIAEQDSTSSGGRGRSQDVVSLAANLDPSESDLAPIDPDELVASVGLREQVAAGDAELARTPEEQEGRQGFWWYLLILALALLVAESILSNRLSRSSAAVA